MSSTEYKLLTPQTARQLVKDLNSLKQGDMIAFTMRGAGLRFSAALRCGYNAKRKEVRCVFDGNKNTIIVLPVSSPTILARGCVSLDNGTPPRGVGRGEHETRWKMADGHLRVVTSRVVQLDENVLGVWSDWRDFEPVGTPTRRGRRLLKSHPFDTQMFGPLCEKIED
jgi:hypothetical protein